MSYKNEDSENMINVLKSQWKIIMAKLETP